MTRAPSSPGLFDLLRPFVAGSIYGAAVPIALYFSFTRTSGLRAAMLATVVWTLVVQAVFLTRRRRLEMLTLLGLAIDLSQTTLALITDSRLVFFSRYMTGNLVMGLAFLTTIAIGRPYISEVAHQLYPQYRRELALPEARRFFLRTTLVWAAFYFARSGLRAAVYPFLPNDVFVVFAELTGVPVMSVLLVATLVLGSRRLIEIVGGERPAHLPAAAPAAGQ